MKRKCLALVLAAVMAAGMMAGCTQTPPATDPETVPATIEQTQAAQPQEAQTIDQITIGTLSQIETATREEYAYDMLASGVSEMPLVYQDTAGDFHPLLADFHTEDGKVWTYTVEEGMCWNDGTPVTAEDILFTLNYEDAGGSANFVDQTDAEGKTTKAKYTDCTVSEDGRSISLTLAAPNVRALSGMTSFRVMPKHIYEGNDAPTEADRRVTCGPYQLEQFHKESGTLTFVPNPHFPGKPHVEKIVYRLFNNADTMYLALQSGDIDMVWDYSQGVPASYQQVLAQDNSILLTNVPAANAPAVLVFNNTNGIFADGNLRKAVSCALDYEVFKTYFGSPYAQTPGMGFVPSTTVGYRQTPALHQDLDQMKEHLAAAGYTQRNADGHYVNANGAVLGFTLTVNADKQTHMGYAELIKTQLEQAGIQVTLDAVDKASYNAKTSNKFSENHITMEAAIFGYTAAGMGMGNGLGTIYVDGRHPVQGGAQVFDEEFQSILTQMEQAKDLEQYKRAAGQMQEFYAEQMPLLALYWDNMMYACSAGLDHVTVDNTFGLNNIPNWFTITRK